MPDTFTPTLNLIKPASSSLAWDPKLNGNFDIIDTLEPRIAALEGILGGTTAGVTQLALGSTWADFVAAYDAAPDNPVARHEIRLANEVLVQTAAIRWLKHVNLRGSGSASEIRLLGNVTQLGASDAFIIGGSPQSHLDGGLIFSDFRYFQDRVAGGSGFRNNPFSVAEYTNNIFLKNIDFFNVTANAIQVLHIQSDFTGFTRNTFIQNINCTEWYEAIIIIDACNVDGCYILNVSGTTSSGNPLGGISRPQGIFIGNEQIPLGLIKNVVVAGGTIDMRPMGKNNGQTLGHTLSSGFQTGGAGGAAGEKWRYDNITITQTKVYGAEIAYRVQQTRGEAYGALLIADYELDEKSGPRYDSYYLNNLHLTDHNYVQQTTGHLGFAAKLTRASSHYFSHADDPKYDFGDTHFSIDAWVYLASKPAGPMVIASKWNTTGNQRGYSLYWDNATDRFVFAVSANGTAVTTVSATTFGPPTLNTWYYITAIHNPTDNLIKIAVNGGGLNSAAHSSGAFANTAEFRIGADHQGNYWDGRLEKVRLYFYALDLIVTGSNIKYIQLYNFGAGYTYQDLDDMGGYTHTTIVDNESFEIGDDHLVLQQNGDDYYTFSGNKFHIFPNQAGFSNRGTATHIAISRPNQIINPVAFFLREGLLSSWDFVSGSRLLDSTATGNTLTNNNAVTFTAGVVGDTAHFVRASAQSLSHASNATLGMGNEDYSILAWVRLATKPGAGTRMVIVSKEASGLTEFTLCYGGTADRFEYYLSSNGTSITGLSCETFGAPAIATWYHVVASYNARTGTMSLEVNNSGPDTTAHSSGALEGNAPFEIGAVNALHCWNGDIGPLRIYNRVLTASEIAAHYNAGAGLTYAQLVAF
jgi:Concanavalin A-like lectin/glucanases superfamily